MGNPVADFSSEAVRRWIVPAADPGATIGAINAAAAEACRAYREARDLSAGAVIPDDALRFYPRGEGIVIEFVTEEPS